MEFSAWNIERDNTFVAYYQADPAVLQGHGVNGTEELLLKTLTTTVLQAHLFIPIRSYFDKDNLLPSDLGTGLTIAPHLVVLC